MGQYQLQAVIRTFTPRFGSYRFGIQDHPVAVATAIKVLGLFHPIGLLPSHALPIPMHVDSDWKPAMGRKPEKLFFIPV